MARSRWLWAVAVWALAGCASTQGAGKGREVRFPETPIVADLELERLNDEELFAAGTSAFAAEDFQNSARYFGRIADFHPQSRHWRSALYNAGLSHSKRQEWESAQLRFQELADPEKGTGDALDASFRVAETLYHQDRYADAATLLGTIAGRADLPMNKRIEAQVQQGICQLEQGESQQAEQTLRKALQQYGELLDPSEVDEYFPAQAQFFLGEIYRLHYESVTLDPEKGADQLSKDLEYKAELLLSSQGHYLRAIRMGNGYWATAAGAQIGGLYENLYDHMINAPVPKELEPAAGEIYRQELRKKIRVLITKSISVYERTLEAAERIGAQNPFVEKTRERLQKMKDLLLADAAGDEEETGSAAPDGSAPREGAEEPPKPGAPEGTEPRS